MATLIPDNPSQPKPTGLSEKLRGYWEIMRFHKPIGTWLLAAPTVWALSLIHI